MKINTIEHKDVFEYLKSVEDNTVDLAIIDPPYNLDQGDWDRFESTQKFLDFTEKYLNLVVSKLKNTGSLYIFNTAYNSAYILVILEKLNLKRVLFV